MKKSLKIALVSTLTLAMAFSATLGFAATTHKKTVKHKVKAAVIYPVLTKTAGTFKVTNVNKTASVAGLKTLKVQTSLTAYYTLSNLVPVSNVVTALGGTVSVNTTGLATFNYDGSTTTLQLKAAKGGNAYKIGTVWYASAPAVADKLVNSVLGSKVAFDATTLTFTRDKASAVGNEWVGSIHNKANWETGLTTEATIPGCARCHNGFVYSNYDKLTVSGSSIVVTTPFQNYATGDTIILTGAGAVEMNFTCTVCHANRGGTAKNTGTTPTLLNGMVINGAGTGAVCMSCHEGRNKLPGTNAATGVAPHHSGQTDMLFGNTGYRYPGTDHAVRAVGMAHAATPSACVGCHMANKVDGVSNHTMQINGSATCVLCHNGLTSLNRLAFGDYDGNKKVEPIQAEVTGLEQVLTTAIQNKVQTDLATDSAITVTSAGGKLVINATDNTGAVKNVTWDAGLGSDALTIYRAAFNLETVQYEGSTGIHNPTFAVSLLQAAYKDLTGTDVPNATIRY